MPIPASQIVSVSTGVLAPGGSNLTFAGMFLTNNTAVPIGAPTSFANLTAVGNYFGTGSTEYAAAQVYYQGSDTSTVKPGLLWFAQYPSSAVSAYLRGGSVTSLAAVQAITAGSLSVTIDGTLKSTSTLNLSSATSLSNAASLIATALTLSGGQTCTYSSQFNAFVITSGTTGGTSTITYASGNAAAVLKLDQADGAVISPGAAAATESAFMTQLLTYTTNWVTFTTMWEPLIASKEAFATWVGGQSNRYAYVVWDTDATILQTPSAYAGLGAYLKTNNISGVVPIYKNILTAAFVCGIAASTDYTALNGRTNFEFRTNSQIPAADVTDQTSYSNMIANGYSAYCNFSVQSQPNMLANGQISGPFLWCDSYFGSIFLKVNFQADLVALLQAQNSIPYNSQGYALIQAACQDTINAGLNNGVIRSGVTPSASEAAQMNAAAGLRIDNYLGTRGWYFQAKDPGATARAARQTPICNFWYMDGQSVQQINLASIDVL